MTTDSEKILHLEDQRKKLQAFKDYVHERLDKMGVPSFPEGEHSKAGCRVGDRMDIIEKQILQLKAIREDNMRKAE